MPTPSSTRNDIALTTTHIHGISEMADLIRSHNWSGAAVGPIEVWPESLRNAVNLMLGCGFPTAIWWDGGNGPQLYNDGYRPFLGAKHPTGLGQCARECWKEAWELVGEQVDSVMREGRPLFFENRLVPIERNGVLEDVYWRYSYSPIFGPSGKSEGVMVTCQDVTDAVISARRLEQSTETLGQVLEATKDAVMSVDREWKITYLNPSAEALYGAGDELLHKVIWEAFPESVYEGSPFLEHLNNAMHRNLSAQFEAYHPDPLNLWIDLEVYPTKTGIVTFSRDVSELKRAQAALLQNEKLAAVGRLAASIAHEINNPLEWVTNLLYLARNCQNNTELEDYLGTAERELRLVSIITTQTLRFYKQASNAPCVSSEELFGSVLSIYQGRFVNSGISVENRSRAVLPVECFEGEIRQVLTNLVGDAIDAMHSFGGRLILRSREGLNWRTGEKGIVLTVADTGHGMEPQVLEKISMLFIQPKESEEPAWVCG